MAAAGMDALLPATALAVALVAIDEAQRNDLSQQYFLEEDPANDLPRERLTRSQTQRKDVETCAWAQLLEDKDLEDSTSITAKQFLVEFRVLDCCDGRRRSGKSPSGAQDAGLADYTGGGNCFASIYQMSWMSAKTVQGMFHKLCRHFAREMYDEHITSLRKRAASWTTQGGVPTIAYQVTVDHAGRAIAVTEGFTGSTNDKTIFCWDAAVEKIRTDKQYTDKTFDVYNEDGTTTTLKGCYLLVDNGTEPVFAFHLSVVFFHWQILIEPSKNPLSENDLLFSKRLESGRVRTLKLAMVYQSQERIDNVFFTCCILHNMLHTFDGIDQLVENTNWVSSAGVGATLATEPESDCGSVGTKDVNDQPQLEIGHTVRKRQLTTSFAYRKKHKKDIVWLSR
ncbi:unnamed protein product [Ectocarpus sp. CCAP 1310/34]|nr:unnamed protein product [Ectocarpus sp. CCAP 1310/34]